MTTYTLRLEVKEVRTSIRTIVIEADSRYSAQLQLLAFPDEQFVEDAAAGELSATGMAFNTACNESEWAYGDWDAEAAEIEDPDHILNEENI